MHLSKLLATVLLMLCAGDSWLLAADPPSFHEDVIPLFTRFGCSSGGCHGKLAGQNGFRLSLRGYAPELDYESIVFESRGRRLNFAAPELSLLVRKALGEVPHGGGQQIKPGTQAEHTLLAWIKAGAPRPTSEEPRLQQIALTPATQTMTVGQSQRISVTANYSDGEQRDVSWLTQFASSDSGVLNVSPQRSRHRSAYR